MRFQHRGEEKCSFTIFRIYVTSALLFQPASSTSPGHIKHVLYFHYVQLGSTAISLSEHFQSHKIEVAASPRLPTVRSAMGVAEVSREALILSRRAGFHLLSTLIKDSVDSVAGSRWKIAGGETGDDEAFKAKIKVKNVDSEKACGTVRYQMHNTAMEDVRRGLFLLIIPDTASKHNSRQINLDP